MITNKVGPTTMFLKEILIPPNNIMFTMERDYGSYTSSHEYFFNPEEFLEFFKPLVEYYGKLDAEHNS